MGLDRIFMMIARIFMRKAVTKGINHGIQYMSKDPKPQPEQITQDTQDGPWGGEHVEEKPQLTPEERRARRAERKARQQEREQRKQSREMQKRARQAGRMINRIGRF